MSLLLSCLVAVRVSPVLEAGLVMSVETYFGAILRSNATVSLE